MSVRLASGIFRIAAIYGVIVLLPLYFAPVPDPWRLTHLGFVGLALVFQGLFWTIARDPARYHSVMVIAVLEKLCFGIPALAFYLRGQTDALVAIFGFLDLVWAVLFYIVWRRLVIPS